MTTLIIDYSQGHHVRHWEEHRHTWLFSDIMVPTIQHGQLVVCSDSYHFGRATHICGWLVFNWSSDSKQALWSVSMSMDIIILMLLLLLGVRKKVLSELLDLALIIQGTLSVGATPPNIEVVAQSQWQVLKLLFKHQSASKKYNSSI